MKKLLLICGFISILPITNIRAQASEPFIGQIAYVAFTFAPNGWAECNGQLLSVSQYSALFSLLGTTYGGNGTTTFALPDMRGRAVIHNGQNFGPTNYFQGEKIGTETVTLNISEMPTHNHTVKAVVADGNSSVPTGNLPANTKTLDKEYSDATATTNMSESMVQPAGGNLAHENRPPSLVLKCIIALQGIYPSRN